MAVCRELTKLHEEVRRGTAGELAAHYVQTAPRGEIVLVVGAAASRAAIVMRRSLRCGPDRRGARVLPAAAVVAKLTGVGANDLYRALHSKGLDSRQPGRRRRRRHRGPG